VYTLDRWQALQSPSGKYSVQRNAGGVTPPTGFINYLGVTSLSAYSVGAAEYFGIRQSIEGFNTADLGWGTASAATITLSFWVRSSLTGTFGGALQNNAQNRFYAFQYTISAANTWEQKTVTIAGDTTGTWTTDNTAGIRLTFGLGVGSSLSIAAGAWGSTTGFSATGATSVVGTNGATFYITGVQLEAGTSATPFEYRDYGRELMMCQRYLPAWNAGGSTTYRLPASGVCATNTIAFITIIFPVVTRVPPTGLSASAASDFLIHIDGLSAQNGTAITYTSQVSNYALRILANVASGLTMGLPVFMDFRVGTGQLLLTGCEL
jgi:hypothetical protein